jgi:hypothetical protein
MAGFGVPGEEIGKFVKMRSRVGFSFGNLGPQRLEVIALISLLAAGPVGLGKSPEGPGEVGIMHALSIDSRNFVSISSRFPESSKEPRRTRRRQRRQ